MKIKLEKFKADAADVMIVPVTSDTKVPYPKEVKAVLAKAKKAELWDAKLGEIYVSEPPAKLKAKAMFVGLGPAGELTTDKLRLTASKALKKMRELGLKKAFIETYEFEGREDSVAAFAAAAFEGFCLADYSFDKYKSEKKEKSVVEVCFGAIDKPADAETLAALGEAEDLASATLFARALVNEPPNELYPESLGKLALAAAKKFGYEAEVFGRQKIKRLGMEAFLAVSDGSAREAKLIVLRYNGNKKKGAEVLGFVGKGITFDSGGNNLKPGDSMLTMKNDMSGAAAVIGAMNAIAGRKLKVNVVAVVAATENILSGAAYKPGDIIKAMGGKTIEVRNTDAEGRVTLADAVTYIIKKEKVSNVIDVATLTGAAVVALGSTTTAAITNNEELYARYEAAAKKTGEKVWLLPSYDEYKEGLKSDVADLANVGNREAGTINGGLFIGAFAEDTPWLHLDIAGTSWSEADQGYLSKGGTGVCVRSLYRLAKDSEG
jgi:leucyl aminopeptidase